MLKCELCISVYAHMDHRGETVLMAYTSLNVLMNVDECRRQQINSFEGELAVQPEEEKKVLAVHRN